MRYLLTLIISISFGLFLIGCGSDAVQLNVNGENLSQNDIDNLISIAKKSSDINKRRKAVDKLGETKDEKARLALIELLKDDAIRYNSALALGKMKNKNSFSALKEGITSSDKLFRFACVRSIANLNIIEAEEVLITKLNDPDTKIKLAAIYGLDLLGSEKSIPALIKISEDQDAEVKKNSLYSVERTLQKMDTDDIVKLLKKSKSSSMRNIIIDFLGRFQETKALPDIIAIMKNKETPNSTVSACAKAIERMKELSAKKDLAATLKMRTDIQVRQDIKNAIEVLEKND